MTAWDDLVGKKVAGYDSFPTPVSNKSFNKPNCTWYCWNRASYQAGKQLTSNSSANAYQWLDAVDTSNCTVVRGKLIPVRDSVVVYSGGSEGNGPIYSVRL